MSLLVAQSKPWISGRAISEHPFIFQQPVGLILFGYLLFEVFETIFSNRPKDLSDLIRGSFCDT